MPKRRHLTLRTRPYSARRINNRDLRERFLIVCEGEKTEPNYFKAFRVNRDVVQIDIHGAGYNTLRLVQEARRLKAQDEYDQVWCVFDRDEFPIRHFNDAVDLARKSDIRVAYSNPAFELWYFLHFHYLDTGIPRQEYTRRLSSLLGHRYEKNSGTIYDELLERQPEATRNARNLLAQYSPLKPARDNPSTTVHQLVAELNRFLT
jgi:hypothetical protein